REPRRTHQRARVRRRCAAGLRSARYRRQRRARRRRDRRSAATREEREARITRAKRDRRNAATASAPTPSRLLLVYARPPITFRCPGGRAFRASQPVATPGVACSALSNKNHFHSHLHLNENHYHSS